MWWCDVITVWWWVGGRREGNGGVEGRQPQHAVRQPVRQPHWLSDNNNTARKGTTTYRTCAAHSAYLLPPVPHLLTAQQHPPSLPYYLVLVRQSFESVQQQGDAALKQRQHRVTKVKTLLLCGVEVGQGTVTLAVTTTRNWGLTPPTKPAPLSANRSAAVVQPHADPALWHELQPHTPTAHHHLPPPPPALCIHSTARHTHTPAVRECQK